MSLEKYLKKRNFKITPEPQGILGFKKNNESTIFVIQKHQASHLHYDLRLEVNDTLKSWAISKDIFIEPYKKKLAIETEDHPLEYANFTGIIPQGEYGAGEVELWDNGTYENVTQKEGKIIPIIQAIKEGHLTVMLKGNKLNGEFTLILLRKTKNSKQWLFFKKHKNK
jgi:bifunctional non-homologous end joining protein LigD